MNRISPVDYLNLNRRLSLLQLRTRAEGNKNKKYFDPNSLVTTERSIAGSSRNIFGSYNFDLNDLKKRRVIKLLL